MATQDEQELLALQLYCDAMAEILSLTEFNMMMKSGRVAQWYEGERIEKEQVLYTVETE